MLSLLVVHCLQILSYMIKNICIPLSNDFSRYEIFYQETGKNLKYVGGYIEYALPISIYDETHPKMILDTYGHKNPWVSETEIKENGAIIMTRHYDTLDETAKRLVPYLDKPQNIDPIGYDFKIYNKLRKERRYTMYYTVIKPIEN